jgi:hypothetical protein
MTILVYCYRPEGRQYPQTNSKRMQRDEAGILPPVDNLRDSNNMYHSRRFFAFAPIEQPLQSGSDIRLVSFGSFECREAHVEDMWETRVTANSSVP